MIRIFLLFVLCASPTYALEFQKQELVFSNGKKLRVEIAESFKERAQGLMDRTSLKENSGMLFSFSKPQKLNFWMKNTYIPLSIGYFDSKMVLKEIYKMKAQNIMEKFQDTKNYPSHCRCQYALEVNQGWFKKNNIQVGATIKLIPLSSKSEK